MLSSVKLSLSSTLRLLEYLKHNSHTSVSETLCIKEYIYHFNYIRFIRKRETIICNNMILLGSWINSNDTILLKKKYAQIEKIFVIKFKSCIIENHVVTHDESANMLQVQSFAKPYSSDQDHPCTLQPLTTQKRTRAEESNKKRHSLSCRKKKESL